MASSIPGHPRGVEVAPVPLTPSSRPISNSTAMNPEPPCTAPSVHLQHGSPPPAAVPPPSVGNRPRPAPAPPLWCPRAPCPAPRRSLLLRALVTNPILVSRPEGTLRSTGTWVVVFADKQARNTQLHKSCPLQRERRPDRPRRPRGQRCQYTRPSRPAGGPEGRSGGERTTPTHTPTQSLPNTEDIREQARRQGGLETGSGDAMSRGRDPGTTSAPRAEAHLPRTEKGKQPPRDQAGGRMGTFQKVS